MYTKEEIWKPVIGWEGMYEVSSFGRVRSVGRNVNYKNGGIRFWPSVFITPFFSKSCKYYLVSFSKESFHYKFLIHRLVAIAFVDNPLNLLEVNHKDGNRLNNNYLNLQWSTRTENVQHALITGLIKKNGPKGESKLLKEQVLLIRMLHNKGNSKLSLSKQFKVARTTIYKIISRKTWKNV